MFVEVVVDIRNSSVDKIFYYKVPGEYKDKNLLGYRVEVPFANRTIQGYVVNVLEKSPSENIKYKFIKKIRDDFPVLTRELILLSEVLADELYCNRINVIETMLPTILKNKYVEYYILKENNNTLFEYKKYFSKEGIVEKKKLKQKLSVEQIEYLLVNNIIKLIQISKNQLKQEQESYIALLETYTEQKLTPKQKQLFDYLLENKEIKKKEIKDKLNIGETVLKKLIEYKLAQEIFKPKSKVEENNNIVYINKNTLNAGQRNVVDTIFKSSDSKFEEYLLHGVTGSGKTEIYIHLVEEFLKFDRECIILIPEIILTPQMEKRFKDIFGNKIAILHSRLNKTEKYNEWKKIEEVKVKICLGTRSAIFAPFKNLGLIIVDEEHESSYKQNDTPRYDAKDVAKKRAIFNNAKVIYASATPSVDLYYYFEQNKPENILKLEKRYNDLLPIIKTTFLENREDIISNDLLAEINNTVDKGEQVLLFINKRGYTNFIRCFNCNYIYKCENCDITLNYHKKNNTLQCHFCGYSKKISQIEKCCEEPNLVTGSYGIQKIEEFILENVKNAKVIRMDSDTTRKKGAYEKLLNQFREQKGNILIGTQMVSKGLDFPNITLVGIMSLENMVGIPSFKSNERLFQLIVQTSGRSGRSDKQGKVIIQSNIDSKILDYAIKNQYLDFYKYEVNRRKLLNYPPFCKISFITIKGIDENKTKLSAISIYNFLIKHYDKNNILGPNKSIFYKINKEFIFNISIRFLDIEYKKLHKLLKYINNYFNDTYKKDKISIIIDNYPYDYI